MQVMYAENLQVRQGGKGTPPLVPSRSLSARSDSTSSILQPRSGKQYFHYGQMAGYRPWPPHRAYAARNAQELSKWKCRAWMAE